jgi:endoglucanase
MKSFGMKTALGLCGMLMLINCGRRQAMELDREFRTSMITISDLQAEGSSLAPTWNQMDVSMERIAPEQLSISKSYQKQSDSNASFSISYGSYRIAIRYLDANATPIYESCASEKTVEHVIDVPRYMVKIQICPLGSSTPMGSVEMGGDAGVDPILVGKPKNPAPVKPNPTPTPTMTPAPGKPAGNFVDQHGFLTVQGNQIVDKNKQPIQLRGMSLFWSHWSSQFWNKNVIATLKNDWKSTVVRAAMGVEEGGYLTNPQAEKDRVKLVVEQAVSLGMYVIIDWHDHNADLHPESAVAFFSEMAGFYANTPNVIFEVFNEPVNQSWDQVKSYSETVIAAIRAKGAKNLVIVGSPMWSQRVDQAADNPIRASNVAYTLHFYAATHKQDLRDKAIYALNKGLALFVTEFGVCDASGNGAIDLAETDIWMAFMDKYKISWANWSVNDKAESASALKPGANVNGGWAAADLTVSGDYIKKKIMAGSN